MKGIITGSLGDLRLVAAGKQLLGGKDWRVFPDFLSAYLGSCLNLSWGEGELQKPIGEQHPINQWYSLLVRQQNHVERTHDGLLRCNSGAARAWYRLAYDLYLIEHNAELQKRLIGKLRDRTHFQGARFEVAVAAMMLAAGYELEFCDEKGPGKHPEFIAKSAVTGTRLAVEAKSRHRPGVLGYMPTKPSAFGGIFDIDSLLRKALSKDTLEPWVVFIELNAPVSMDRVVHSAAYKQLNEAWMKVQRLPWPDGFPSVAAVFYNDTAPWSLDAPFDKASAALWFIALWPDHTRHDCDTKQLVHEIGRGCANRFKIPHEFPQ